MQALVATVDLVDAFSLLQNMAPMSYDGSRLLDTACIAFSNFTGDKLNSLREAYTSSVMSQFHVRVHCSYSWHNRIGMTPDCAVR